MLQCVLQCVFQCIAVCCSVLHLFVARGVCAFDANAGHDIFVCAMAHSCCGVLQCAAVCFSVLQCVAVCCSVLHLFVARGVFAFDANAGHDIFVCAMAHSCCGVLQCVAVCCSMSKCVAVCCSTW